MRISYRTQQALKRLMIILLCIVLVFALYMLFRYFHLARYVVYTRDGVQLQYDLPATFPQGQQAQPTVPDDPVSIYYDDGNSFVDTSTELKQLGGYYIDAAALADISLVRSQLQALPAGTPVLVDVKSAYGNFYYSSGVGTARSSSISASAMDSLISYLRSSNLYTIARLPALRDYYYGLSHVSDGLEVKGGGYLWADKDYCYWLNPDSSGTINYLASIALELRNLGFDEVVFDDFCFPDTDKIAYSGDQTAALSRAAETLVSTCATERFAISFEGQNAAFPLPQGRCRLYLSDIPAANAERVAEQTGLEDPAVHLVFLTEFHDTRFDVYSVLRPLAAAH